MAFVSNNQIQDDEKKDIAGSTTGPVSPSGSGGAVHLAPSSSVPSGGGGVGGGTSPAGAGGQFASLNQYLAANQGQASPLAGRITEGVNKQYGDLDTGNTSTIASINNQVTNAPGYTASNPDILKAEQENPVSFANDTNNIKQFQGLLNNTYGGPASAESTNEFGQQQTAINNAIAKGQNATKTEAGRENLLKDTQASKNTGVTALNSAILSQDPNALKSVQTAYDPFKNLLSGLNTGAQGVNTTIGKETADAAQSKAAANAQIANQINELNTNVNKNLGTATSARDAYNKAVNDTRTVWNPVNTEINSLNEVLGRITQGMTPVQGGTSSVNNPLGQYVNAPLATNAPTLGAVATSEDYAKAAAFQNLMAGLNTGNPIPVLNPADAALAGTYQAPTASTITDPKAQAKALYDAMNRTISVNKGGPNGSNYYEANPWFNATTSGDVPRYQQAVQETNPIYANLTKLLNDIYGSNIAASE